MFLHALYRSVLCVYLLQLEAEKNEDVMKILAVGILLAVIALSAFQSLLIYTETMPGRTKIIG